MKALYLKNVWKYLIRPYWTSENRWMAYALLAGHLVTMGLYIAVNVRMNFLHNTLFEALENFNMKGFFAVVGESALYGVGFIAVFAVKTYLLQKLEINWREWMTTHFLKGWTQDQRYYKLQLQGNGSDNPDQRISEDITSFINTSMRLSLELVSEVITLFSFLGILWALSGTEDFTIGEYAISIPGYMCWGALLFAAGGSFCTVYFGRNLVSLSYESEKREANFRYGLVRFRENSESVAFYKGETKERAILGTRFQEIIDNFYAVLHRMTIMNVWFSFYRQASNLFPLLLLVPRYFAHKMTMGTLMQVLDAYKTVSEALSFIVDTYPRIAHWRATTNRLLEFKMSLDTMPDSAFVFETHASPNISLACEEIALPSGKVVHQGLDLTFNQGEDTLITGPTGIGKSTLARVAAGLWPYGKGHVRLPGAALLFLPQKPYMPLGTLEEALCYPKSPESVEGDFQAILQSVGLGDLFKRLGETNDWSRVLSLGEQQRLAIARVLLVKPKWLFMDEATSSMNEESEAQLYHLLKHKLPDMTIISIGHRGSLRGVHAREIALGSPTPALTAAVA